VREWRPRAVGGKNKREKPRTAATAPLSGLQLEGLPPLSRRPVARSPRPPPALRAGRALAQSCRGRAGNLIETERCPWSRGRPARAEPKGGGPRRRCGTARRSSLLPPLSQWLGEAPRPPPLLRPPPSFFFLWSSRGGSEPASASQERLKREERNGGGGGAIRPFPPDARARESGNPTGGAREDGGAALPGPRRFRKGAGLARERERGGTHARKLGFFFPIGALPPLLLSPPLSPASIHARARPPRPV